jgi:hypothetical protein
MLAFIAPLFLFGGPIGPNIPLPDALEVCILKAEICATEGRLPICGGEVAVPRHQCISDYEDCSYTIPESHEPSCRLDYVWCRLESFAGYEPAKWCKEVYQTCPSIDFAFEW